MQRFLHVQRVASGTVRPRESMADSKKKGPTPKPLFRQRHGSIPDSLTGRLQLLVPQTISILTRRLDGLSHAGTMTRLTLDCQH
jgi:hypothetical protein